MNQLKNVIISHKVQVVADTKWRGIPKTESIKRFTEVDLWFLFLIFGSGISKIRATEATKEDNLELICDFKGSFFLFAIFSSFSREGDGGG